MACINPVNESINQSHNARETVWGDPFRNSKTFVGNPFSEHHQNGDNPFRNTINVIVNTTENARIHKPYLPSPLLREMVPEKESAARNETYKRWRRLRKDQENL